MHIILQPLRSTALTAVLPDRNTRDRSQWPAADGRGKSASIQAYRKSSNYYYSHAQRRLRNQRDGRATGRHLSCRWHVQMPLNRPGRQSLGDARRQPRYSDAPHWRREERTCRHHRRLLPVKHPSTFASYLRHIQRNTQRKERPSYLGKLDTVRSVTAQPRFSVYTTSPTLFIDPPHHVVARANQDQLQGAIHNSPQDVKGGCCRL